MSKGSALLRLLIMLALMALTLYAGEQAKEKKEENAQLHKEIEYLELENFELMSRIWELNSHIEKMENE
jgi:hypothetical protein